MTKGYGTVRSTMANPFTRRSSGPSDRTFRVTFRFSTAGPVSPISSGWGYGVTKSALTLPVARSVFTSSLAAQLTGQFGTGMPVSNVVFTLGAASQEIGSQGSSGQSISFDLIDNGRRYGDTPSAADKALIQVHVARAFASAYSAYGPNASLLVTATQANPAGGGTAGGYRFEGLTTVLTQPGTAATTGSGSGSGSGTGTGSGTGSGSGGSTTTTTTTAAPSDAVVAARALKVLVATNSRVREGAFSAEVQGLQRRMGITGTAADGRYGPRTQAVMEGLLSGTSTTTTGGGTATTGGGTATTGGGTSTPAIQLPPAPPAPTEDQMAAARDLVSFVTSSAPGTLVSAAGRAVFSQRVSDLQARMGGGIAVDGLYGSESRRRIEILIGGTAPMARGPQGATVAVVTTADRTAQEHRATTEAGLLGGLGGGGGSSKMSTATIAAIGVGVIVVSVAFAYATGALGGSAGAVVAVPSRSPARSRGYQSKATKRSGR